MQSQSKLQDLESSKLRLQRRAERCPIPALNHRDLDSDEIDALKNRILEIDEKLANSEARRSIEIRAPEAGVVTAISLIRGRRSARGRRC